MNDPRWEYLVDKYCCRNGACLNRKNARKELGIKFRRISRDSIPSHLPALLTSWTKVGFHASLVIDYKEDKWTIVNYDGYKGETVMVINKNDIEFLKRGHSEDRHYYLYL